MVAEALRDAFLSMSYIAASKFECPLYKVIHSIREHVETVQKLWSHLVILGI